MTSTGSLRNRIAAAEDIEDLGTRTRVLTRIADEAADIADAATTLPIVHDPVNGITMALDLSKMSFGTLRDEEGDAIGNMDMRDWIVQEAARLLVESLKLTRSDKDREDVPRAVRDRALEMLNAEIAAQVGPLVAAALTDPRQPTNGFGSPIGSPTTLTDLIQKQASDLLANRGDSYNRDGALTKIIKAEVDRAFERELKEAMAEAKGKITAAVTQKAAEVLGETIAAMAEAVG